MHVYMYVCMYVSKGRNHWGVGGQDPNILINSPNFRQLFTWMSV